MSDRLFASLPDGVRVNKSVGGLAPDSDAPMPDNLRIALPRAWQKIHDMLGTEFNFDFWTECEPRRSTYPACRAVLAAGKQDRYDQMTDAIQRAYYLRAMNPSDLETLQLLAEELGLDRDRFAADIRSSGVEADLQRQVEFARQSPIDGFPSLVLELDGSMVSITRDYKDHLPTLEHVERMLV